MKKYHIQKTLNKTLCGTRIKNNNIVIDVNHCTCKKCNKIVNNIVKLWDNVGMLIIYQMIKNLLLHICLKKQKIL